eukprot:m.453479 g.453479  ORF g.453479 m.453479 type:complete len:220 (-) comp56936_c0_seq7:3144-3803(-)
MVAWVRTLLICFGRLVQLLALAVVGGMLNRARGGWLDLSSLSYASQHVLPRAVVGLTSGSLVGLLSRNSLLGIVIGITMWASIYVGWGAYMSVGHSTSDYTSRTGCFDWLLGRDEESWDFTRRWVREFAGMSLRGLMWTAPGGYIMYHMGYGWQFALAGAAMGSIYSISFESPSTLINFSSGTEMAEFLFGSVARWLRDPSRIFALRDLLTRIGVCCML